MAPSDHLPLTVLSSVFVLLCVVALILCAQQWKVHGERRWEAALTVAFGCVAVVMYLMRFDSPQRLSTRTWAACAATLLSLAWVNAAARARWRRKRSASAQDETKEEA